MTKFYVNSWSNNVNIHHFTTNNVTMFRWKQFNTYYFLFIINTLCKVKIHPVITFFYIISSLQVTTPPQKNLATGRTVQEWEPAWRTRDFFWSASVLVNAKMSIHSSSVMQRQVQLISPNIKVLVYSFRLCVEITEESCSIIHMFHVYVKFNGKCPCANEVSLKDKGDISSQ